MSDILVEQTGHAVIQDLGRPGYAWMGIPANGAADQHSARTANILVGNAEMSPLIEVTGSDLTLVAGSNVLLAVTGAAEHVVVDGFEQPVWEPLAVARDSRVIVPAGRLGLRSYVAVNGELEADYALGSVAPDAVLGVGRRLAIGDQLRVRSRYRADLWGPHAPLFRFDASRPKLSSAARVDATPGPDLARMKLGAACLSAAYEVANQSDHVGLRLLGPAIEQTTSEEILSRGVPVGAVEVPPTGAIIVLMRGRLVTAGYPVIAVVTSDSLDRLGQVRPGDTVEVALCDMESALAKLRQRHDERRQLGKRVRSAFSTTGLTDIVDPRH